VSLTDQALQSMSKLYSLSLPHGSCAAGRRSEYSVPGASRPVHKYLIRRPFVQLDAAAIRSPLFLQGVGRRGV